MKTDAVRLHNFGILLAQPNSCKNVVSRVTTILRYFLVTCKLSHCDVNFPFYRSCLGLVNCITLQSNTALALFKI